MADNEEDMTLSFDADMIEAEGHEGEAARVIAAARTMLDATCLVEDDGSISITCSEELMLAVLQRAKSQQGEPS